jgi:LEA14-like dessication related protein
MKKALLYIIPICVFFFSSCKEYEEIKVTSVENFYINKITVDGIEAEVKLKIKNPNKVGFSIYPSEFDVTFSGMRLGKAKLHKRVHINANEESVYTFKLKSALGELNLFDAMQLLNSGKMGKIEISGDLKAGKFLIKKRYPVNYSEKVPLFK